MNLSDPSGSTPNDTDGPGLTLQDILSDPCGYSLVAPNCTTGGGAGGAAAGAAVIALDPEGDAAAAAVGGALLIAAGVNWLFGQPSSNINFAKKQPPTLSQAEQEAIANKEAGDPYNQADYNSALQKLKQGAKYLGQRRSSQGRSSTKAYVTGGCPGLPSL